MRLLRTAKEWVEVAFLFVMIVCVLWPLSTIQDSWDWLQDHYRNPWRIEYGLFMGVSSCASIMRWYPQCGYPDLAGALSAVMEYQTNRPLYTWRVRHWLSRTSVLAAILA